METFFLVAGSWGSWDSWTDCTVTCNGGTKQRERECDDPQAANDGTPCYGDDLQIITCNSQPCAIDGEWGIWSAWSACSKSCGNGTQDSRRKR